ncbi:TIGR02587 family membrane protein [bacterium]|nr:MAG: TIGR02587 family membrane protein [bacterium]
MATSSKRVTSQSCRTPGQSLQEYGRGVAGGLMFSLPLLYTMEVWWASFVLFPWRLMAYMAATFSLLLAYNRFAGMRRDATWWECVIDSVEELGIGIALSALVLWLLGRIDSKQSFSEIVGRIMIEAMTVAIGVSVGTAQLGGGEGQDDVGLQSEEDKDARAADFLSQMAIALCGGVLFAANVAPTEEVLVIAQENSAIRLLAMAIFSLVLGGYVLFFAEFRGSGRYSHPQNFLNLFRGIVSTYAVALFAAAGTLFFFGRFDGQPLRICIFQMVVLGLPATLGASAGRLLLQSGNSSGGESDDGQE